eukprot:SAG31_NODE_2506_length_5591_cov_4.701384_6_plen_46_part_00
MCGGGGGGGRASRDLATVRGPVERRSAVKFRHVSERRLLNYKNIL